MRTPKYLSPTSLGKSIADMEEFYLQYLADNRPPRFPQTQPMSVGSAFDAYIKNYYHKCLFDTVVPEFEIDTLLVEQVEAHNRDWARAAGKYAFECYKKSGACADLLVELNNAQCAPRFEFTLNKDLFGVPLLGKPDLYYIHKSGTPVILDWKVNGFCAKSAKSPDKGFIKIRDGWEGTPSRGAGGMHKMAQPMLVDGIIINVAHYLEDTNDGWAKQLGTYGWLCGAEIGSPFITALDQLACKPDEANRPKIRVAEHRTRVSKEYQLATVQQYKDLWELIHSDHIFRDKSKEESAARCNMLDKQYLAFQDEEDDFVKEMAGRM